MSTEEIHQPELVSVEAKAVQRGQSFDPISRHFRQAGILGVRSLDLGLRFILGIREFSRRSDCILRVASTRSESAVNLPDGTVIARGAPVLELHLWNEHLALCYGPHGLFGWSFCLERRIRLSLMLLAEYAAKDSESSEYQAIRANFGMSFDGVERAAQRFGFCVRYPSRSASERLHDRLEKILITGLVWTFHPLGLQLSKRCLRRTELWMSKADFVRIYGSSSQSLE